MQTRAIIEAAVELTKKGKKVLPEIMIPLVGHVNEFKLQEKVVRETADKIIKGERRRSEIHGRHNDRASEGRPYRR